MSANNKNSAPKAGGPAAAAVGAPKEKAKDFKGTVKKLIKYLGSYKPAVVIVLVFAIASTVFAIVGPKILGGATTELFQGVMRLAQGSPEGINFDKIGQIMVTLCILYLASAIFGYVQGYIMTGVATKIAFKMRKEIDDKIHKLPFSYYDKTSTGDVLSRITNDVDVINQSLNQSMTQIITSIATIVGIIVMMLSISWQMTLVAIATLPLSFGIIGLIIKKSQKHFTDQQKYIGEVNGQVEENYGAHVVVKAFNGEERAEEKFKVSNDKLFSAAWKANFLSGLMMPIMMFIGNLGYVAVCLVGGYFAANGQINVGDIQAFLQYMRQFTQPISAVSQISNVLQQTIAAAERVFEFLAEEEEKMISDDPLFIEGDRNNPDFIKGKSKEIKITGAVEFNNVSFGYNPDKIIIHNFNSIVKPGQKIAIVGPTGAGKTTMVKLLMRFYDVNAGYISLDGNDIKKFNRESLRSAFGMVLQETWLYNDSIENNIRYGKLDASFEEVKAAAVSAQVDHFVSTLPGGYQMELNEEASNVSQGQKQLLTIARAILADNKILILDEATSSVDTRTEILIQKAMDNLMKGRTSFIIAHRLSTIKNADLILVMDKGDIIEQGSHDELMKAQGFYANLYNSQFAQ
ncbi:MAG: ABC transporter ATP-binding protein [Anaerovoracaceae bacterium]